MLSEAPETSCCKPTALLEGGCLSWALRKLKTLLLSGLLSVLRVRAIPAVRVPHCQWMGVMQPMWEGLKSEQVGFVGMVPSVGVGTSLTWGARAPSERSWTPVRVSLLPWTLSPKSELRRPGRYCWFTEPFDSDMFVFRMKCYALCLWSLRKYFALNNKKWDSVIISNFLGTENAVCFKTAFVKNNNSNSNNSNKHSECQLLWNHPEKYWIRKTGFFFPTGF